jgi:hypothetical protein
MKDIRVRAKVDTGKISQPATKKVERKAEDITVEELEYHLEQERQILEARRR